MNIVDELQKLQGLHSSGAINDDEYDKAKALVLAPAGTQVGEPNALKRFKRSRRDAWLGGVCGGLGAHTPVRSWAWRVGFCVGLLSFGVGLIPYLLLWIFVPAEEEPISDASYGIVATDHH
jgi:phage shock protein PspC (stress-responsive transcriptional regulator)